MINILKKRKHEGTHNILQNKDTSKLWSCRQRMWRNKREILEVESSQHHSQY